METALIVALVISSLVLIGFVISNIDWEEVKDQTMGCAVISAIILLIAYFFFTVTPTLIAILISIIALWFLISSSISFVEKRTEKRKEKFRKERIKVLADKKLLDDIDRLIKKHKSTVRSDYRNTVTSNSFGKKDYSRFIKELEEFIQDNSSVYKELVSLGASFSVNWGDSESIESIEDIIGIHDDETSFESSMDPIEYERLCADLFSKAGWKAKATQASSDQGVDVEAERKGVKLVAQCKRFSKQVGNKAVQEVVAGLKYYEADLGVVIAPNGFTKSAIKLAEANDIKLIHHDEIKDL